MALGDDGNDFYGNPRQPMLNAPEPLRQISEYGGGDPGDSRDGAAERMTFSSMDVPPPPLAVGEKYTGYIQYRGGQVASVYTE